MEVNQNSAQPTSNGGLPLGNGQKPGERLRQVRLAQKRELSDIARELNIPQRLLVALEADDYAALPEPAFVRGYLRSYAKFLGVDGSALVARFAELYTADTGRSPAQALEDSPLKPLARMSSHQHKRSWRWLRWFVVAVLLLGLLYGLYQLASGWLSGLSSETTPVVEESLTILPTTSSAPASTTTTTLNTLPVVGSAVSQADRLVVVLSRATSVRVQDATGKELLSGRQAAGETLQVEGQSPFSIVLPEADAVTSLSLNGQAVNLSPFIVNGRADFRLSR
ncbi:MAG: RodZ domain-containing protein [Pseudomonadota bacterium]|nr:RodZ domain-containing protein [Pseudomonadota bacterium]